MMIIDLPYILWRLNNPVVPSLPSNIQAKTESDMKKPEEAEKKVEFLLYDGMPGTGKTSEVLRAARKREKGVIYLSLTSPSSEDGMKMEGLQALQECLHEAFKSPLSQWKMLSLAGKLSQLSTVCRRWLGLKLLVIIDNVNLLSENDLTQLLYVGKEAKERDLFNLWLVASEEKGEELLTRGRILGLARTEVAPQTEAGLKKICVGILGEDDPVSLELAEFLLHYSGRNIRLLKELAEAVKDSSLEDLLELLPRHKTPQNLNHSDETLWTKLLADETNAGVQFDSVDEMIFSPEVAEMKEVLTEVSCQSCLELCQGWVRARSGSCKDQYRVLFAKEALATGGSNEEETKEKKAALVEAREREWARSMGLRKLVREYRSKKAEKIETEMKSEK